MPKAISCTPLSSYCWNYLIVSEFQGCKIEASRECPQKRDKLRPDHWGRCLRGAPFFSAVVGFEMEEKLYWAAKCKKCRGMVGYRDVRYVIGPGGAKTEEKLPEGRTKLRCDHCGTVSDFDLRQLRPASVKLLLPRLP
jgi:hypothetical protein